MAEKLDKKPRKPGSGVPKDGSRNPSWSNLQSHGEKNNFRLAGLPNQLLRKPEETLKRGLALVEKLRQIEEQMTAWEDGQPVEFLELLPWWEERKKYRELKKTGEVPVVEWWEALAFLERAHPKRFDDEQAWKIKKHAPKKKKAPSGP